MKFLAIGAHPDDIDFTAGGTVAKLVSQDHEVCYCLATNGQAGGQDITMDRAQHAKQRQTEQKLAAEVLGVSSSYHLDLTDGLLESSIELRRALTKVIRNVKPDIVIAPSPRYNLDNVHFLHPDHLAAGAATLAAVYPDSRNKFAFPELGLDPHTVKQVWLVEDTKPDFFVEISDTIGTKFEALSKHSSQFATDHDLKFEVEKSAKRIAELADTSIHLGEGYKRIIYEDIEIDI